MKADRAAKRSISFCHPPPRFLRGFYVSLGASIVCLPQWMYELGFVQARCGSGEHDTDASEKMVAFSGSNWNPDTLTFFYGGIRGTFALPDNLVPAFSTKHHGEPTTRKSQNEIPFVNQLTFNRTRSLYRYESLLNPASRLSNMFLPI